MVAGKAVQYPISPNHVLAICGRTVIKWKWNEKSEQKLQGCHELPHVSQLPPKLSFVDHFAKFTITVPLVRSKIGVIYNLVAWSSTHQLPWEKQTLKAVNYNMHIHSGDARGDERPPGRDPEVQAAADDCQWLLLPLCVGQPGEFQWSHVSSNVNAFTLSTSLLQVLIHEMRERRVIVEHSGRFVDMMPETFRDDVCIFVSHSGNTEVNHSSNPNCKTHTKWPDRLYSRFCKMITESSTYAANLLPSAIMP